MQAIKPKIDVADPVFFDPSIPDFYKNPDPG
jgi:hypothetical protein